MSIRWGMLLHPAFAAALGLMAVSAGAIGLMIDAVGIRLTKLEIYPPDGAQFSSIPREFPGWRQVGSDVFLGKDVVEELGTDLYLSRWYEQTSPPEGRDPIRVELHCAYYTGMIDTVPHVPERCFVGGGAVQAGGTRTVDVPLDFARLVRDPDAPEGEAEPVWMARSGVLHRRYRLPRGVEDLKLTTTPFMNAGQTQYAGYFFIANGKIARTADEVRLAAFQLTNDYAYYAKVQFSSADVASAEELAEVAGQILDEVFADIARCMPDWVEVEAGRYPEDGPGA